MTDAYETQPARLIGYARVSTNDQLHDRQLQDLQAAGCRRHDIFVDQGVSGAHASRPSLDKALSVLQPGDTLVVTTLDRLGRSVMNMLELAQRLRHDGVNLKVLNLGGGSVDTTTPIGNMVFTIMAALAEMELEIKRERIRDSVAKRRAQGQDLGGRREKHSDRVILLIKHTAENNVGYNVEKACKEIGVSRATYYRRIAEIEARQTGAP